MKITKNKDLSCKICVQSKMFELKNKPMIKKGSKILALFFWQQMKDINTY